MITEAESKAVALVIDEQIMTLLADQPTAACLSALGAAVTGVLQEHPQREAVLALLAQGVRDFWNGAPE